MKPRLLLCLALVASTLVAHARVVRWWSETELQQASDLVVVGRPVAVRDLDETNSLGWSGTQLFQPKFRGVETTFKVTYVFKGAPEKDLIVLHHYREVEAWGSPPNGPILISFPPNDTNEYILHLVKDGAGRYAPAAGQVDAYLSIKTLPANYPSQSVLHVTARVPSALSKVKLKFVSVDSEETDGQDNSGKNAVDGNPNTYWHTQWQSQSPGLPHEIIIELLPPSVIKGFTYLPRQDESDHGIIKDYEFYISEDGTNFGQPVKQGVFGPGRDLKTETFAPVKCRFIKLKALSEINGLPWTSAAEIGVIPGGGDGVGGYQPNGGWLAVTTAATIIYPRAPDGGKQVAFESASNILRTDLAFFGGFRIGELTLAEPYRAYGVGLTDLASGHLLSAAESHCWLYPFFHGTEVVGEAQLDDRERNGTLRFDGLYQASFSKATQVALQIAAQLPQIKKQDYELRRLEIPPLLFFAVWLHAKSDDIIIPLPQTFGRWNAYQPYSEGQITKLLKPEAKKKLNTPKGLLD